MQTMRATQMSYKSSLRSLKACPTTEVEGGAAVLMGALSLTRIDRHPADGVLGVGIH